MTERNPVSEILNYQAGREARINGAPRDKRRNADWLRGWDDVDAEDNPRVICPALYQNR